MAERANGTLPEEAAEMSPDKSSSSFPDNSIPAPPPDVCASNPADDVPSLTTLADASACVSRMELDACKSDALKEEEDASSVSS